MSNPKDEYGKGFADGLKEGKYQKDHGVAEKAIRDIGFDPKKGDSVAYKEGFNEGVKDGGGWSYKK